MSDDPMGDDVYQPTGSDLRDNPEDIDHDNSLDERGQDDMLDEGYSPPEKPLAVTGHGTTAREQHDGETLDQRLSEEVPDVGVREGNGIGDQPGMEGEPRSEQIAGDRRAGRIVGDDDRYRRPASDVVASDVGIDGGAASAEEAAMHISEEEPVEEAGEEYGEGGESAA
ncbi:DUF5709 domain-containing protein [Streptomyces sp. NBC_01803]|uniref:DUF5709 domain-containing protein n=1 Tax=Streptomyces sp. NBC_01803 TaxID=2975946 RepID=UPI002DDC5A5B|nr:DUF5709 domain-containing protein [Streptomyces sp. NBC_01803]WSA47375.1 DUF5709 domain-containing protein [Streptomyces sp. NBC_01803]